MKISHCGCCIYHFTYIPKMQDGWNLSCYHGNALPGRPLAVTLLAGQLAPPGDRLGVAARRFRGGLLTGLPPRCTATQGHSEDLLANTKHWSNVRVMLGQGLWRWPNITPTLGECFVLAEKPSCRRAFNLVLMARYRARISRFTGLTLEFPLADPCTWRKWA